MRRFFYLLFIAATIITGIVYLVSCFTQIVSPVHFWPMVFLALGFPYTALVLIAIIILWFFINKKVALLLSLLLLGGFANIRSTVAMNTANTTAPSPASTIRIMGWNVKNFDNPADHADSAMSIRRRMFKYIKEINPDVLCLQDMIEYEGPSFLSNIKALQELGYPYYYKPSEVNYFESYGTLRLGSCIFSKFPLTDTASVLLNDPSYPQKVSFAELEFKGKKCRIYVTHYRSISLFSNNPPTPIPLHYDSTFLYRASKFEKLKVFEKEHAIQAEITRDFMNKSPHPIIFSGDLNTVPTSYAYATTRNGLQDAFLKKGAGLGGSMDSLPKTLRIDYFFVDKQFEIKKYHQDRVSLSDHYPHYIDVEWKRD